MTETKETNEVKTLWQTYLDPLHPSQCAIVERPVVKTFVTTDTGETFYDIGANVFPNEKGELTSWVPQADLGIGREIKTLNAIVCFRVNEEIARANFRSQMYEIAREFRKKAQKYLDKADKFFAQGDLYGKAEFDD